MTFDVTAFNAAEKAAGERRRAELGPGWHVYSEKTKRWEWVPEEKRDGK